MSEEIRDVTTVTFSGPRFADAGLELDVLPELLAYQKLLIETAKELWRSENPDRQRLPRGFEESIRLKFYTIEKGSAAVPIKRVVEHASEQQSLLNSADEIDDAAGLIDETIEAVTADAPLPARMPKSVLPMLALLGAELRPDETIKTQSTRSPRAAEYTVATRERVQRLIEPVYEDRVEITGEVRSADIDQRHFAIRDAGGRKIPAKFQPEQEAEITDALHTHDSCRVHVSGVGEFATRDGSLRRLLRVDSLERRPAEDRDDYDSSVPPLWQSIVALGEALPVEEWDRVPTDLSRNLDHYLYDKPREEQ